MVWGQEGFLAILPSHATRASRSPRARLAFASVPLKYAKITPVLQAIFILPKSSGTGHHVFFGLKPQKCSKHVRDLIFLHTNLMPNVFWYILKLSHSCSSYPTRASDSGQVDWFRNPMKNDLKTTACLEIILNTDANFLNLHIGKATKTLGDKQLYLITHFTKQTLNQNYLPLAKYVTAQLLKFKFSLNGGDLVFLVHF